MEKLNHGKTNALRSKEAAKDRIRSGNYTSARALLLEARQSFPGLDHLSGMIAVCEVLCSASIEFPCYGVDWYWVIQLFPSANSADIEARYLELVSLLEPIRNDFPGTELALNYAKDAFALLSDPVRRMTFDSKRIGMANASESSNSQVQFDGHAVIDGKGSTKEPSDVSMPKRPYLEACSSSDGGFKPPAEISVDERVIKKNCITEEAKWANAQLSSESMATEEYRHCSSETEARKRPPPGFHHFKSNQKASDFSVGEVWVAYDEQNLPRRYARIGRVLLPPHEFMIYVTWLRPCPLVFQEKWSEAGLPIACGSFVLESTKFALRGPSMFSHLLSGGINGQPFEIYPKKGEVWAIYRDWCIEWSCNPGLWRGCGYLLVEILTDYAKCEGVKVACLVKIDGFKYVYQRHLKRGKEVSVLITTDKLLMFSHNVPVYRFLGSETGGISIGMLQLDPLAVPNNVVQDTSCAVVAFMHLAIQSSEVVNCDEDASFVGPSSDPSRKAIDIARPKQVIKKCRMKWNPAQFAALQVWAVYDGPDAMPRAYCKVIDIVSPGQVCVAFLEHQPMLVEESQWKAEGLSIACGMFYVVCRTDFLDMSRFSHLVKYERRKSYYLIFPRKGEVWAMYKHSSRSCRSANLASCEVRIVEILSEFSEESGITVCNLNPFGGSLTIFQRQLHDEFLLTKQISRLGIHSFSHRIPAVAVLGNKDLSIPEGLWQLEPEAIPQKIDS